MTVQIILVDNNYNEIKKYNFDKTESIIDMKNTIVKDMYNGKGYIDIYFLLEKTKRTFGEISNLDNNI